MKYFEEAKSIWKEFVPKSGQANTIQGELLRSIEKLRNEAQNNGNANWDEGFKIIIKYLEKYLVDKNVFGKELIKKTKQDLKLINNSRTPYLEDDIYDELTDRMIEYYKYYGSKENSINPKLKR